MSSSRGYLLTLAFAASFLVLLVLTPSYVLLSSPAGLAALRPRRELQDYYVAKVNLLPPTRSPNTRRPTSRSPATAYPTTRSPTTRSPTTASPSKPRRTPSPEREPTTQPSLPYREYIPGEPRYLSYDYYKGRFGNQVQQAEWAFRLALMTNRTLVVPQPQNKESYAGFPSTWRGAVHERSLWDTQLLQQSPVRLHFFNDSALVPGPHPNCIWNQERYLTAWLYKVNQLDECRGHVHFSTRQGLPGEYRSDTREFGVDPLVFWRYFRFSREVFAFARGELARMLGEEEPEVGIHARTFREASSTQEHVNDRVCGPQTRVMVSDIADRLRARIKCDARAGVGTSSCEASARVLPWTNTSWTALQLRTAWDELHLNETCDVTKNTSFPRITNRTAAQLLHTGFFIATDHDDAEVDELFIERGAKMLNFSLSPVIALRSINGNAIPRLDPLIFDLAALISVQNFYGIPASSLTRAVCFWRLSMDKRSPMCEFFLHRTVSGRCSEQFCDPQAVSCCSSSSSSV